MTSPFPYSPLREDHFRIIEFDAVQPEISIRLVDYPVDGALEYSALSYACGTEPKTEAILCNGKDFKITPHLKESLRQICSHSSHLRLWVDVICINQGSIAEKAAQVAKMHHIYQSAREVYVWLGGEEDGSEELTKAINSLVIPPTQEGDILQRVVKYRSEAPQLFDVSLFKAVAALSRRSWFRRLWTAQEYFYGRSIRFYCGTRRFEGTKLMKMLNKLSIHSFGGREPPDFEEEHDLFVGFQALIALEKIKKSHNEEAPLTFFDFVMLGRARFVTEPVDRIYALFGMAEGTDVIYRKGIPIDYSEEAKTKYWETYTRFGKIALQHERDLRLLSYVSCEERPDQLPSWCPNLHSPTRTADLDQVHVFAAGWPWIKHQECLRDLERDSISCTGHPHFGGKEKRHATVSSTSNTVSIWGASLGQISSIGPSKEWETNINTEDISSAQQLAKDLLNWLLDSEKFCRSHRENGKAARQIWNSILVKETSKSRRKSKIGTDTNIGVRRVEEPEESQILKPEPNSGAADISLLESSENARKDDGEEDEKPDPLEELHEENSVYLFMITVLLKVLDLNPELAWIEQDAELLEHFLSLYIWIVAFDEDWNSRVILATEDHRIGLASEEVAVGDTVCMLYGGRTLYILRPSDAGYRFVCDAYVYNCMNGEIFEDLDQGMVKEELFAIS